MSTGGGDADRTVEGLGDREGAGAAGAPGQMPARRRRWWLRGILALVVLGVLAGGAELALRAIIPQVIASQLREHLGLPDGHPVEVALGGSALVPALSGHVDQVELTIPDLTVFDGIETTLRASADSLPFDPSKGDIVGATASATIPSNSMDEVMALVTNGFVDEGEVRSGELVLGRALPLFGYEVQLTASIAVSVDRGDLRIEPRGVNAAGFDLTAEQLRPLLGEAAAGLLDPHTICIRDQLPAGITLTDIELRSTALGGSATVTAALAPDVLSNPSQQQPGSCDGEQAD